MFGKLGGASSQVRNVRLVNANVIGSGQSVGILVGHSTYGTVANCSSHGEVSGNFYIGGLVGYNVGTVTCCSAEVKVSGMRWSIGGLVGYNGAYVRQSYSTGNVTGNIWTGGLVGENGGTVTECYSTGRVWGTSDVGGLVGYDYDWSQADRCFWDTWTSGRSVSAGGTGKTTNELKRAATFTGWDFENIWIIFEGLTYPKLQWELGGPVSPAPTTIEKVSGDNQSGPPESKLALPLMVRVKDQNGEVMAEVQVDFSITAGDGKVEPSSAVTDSDGIAATELTLGPTPGLNQVDATVAGLSVVFNATGVLPPEGYGGGHGIADDPYQIWTAEHMNAIGANPGDWDKHFKLMADIDLGAFIGARGKTFQMIGVHSSYGQPFSGVFDGNGKAISNFTVTGSDAASQGLFGAVQGTNAEIKNLRLVAVNVNAETRNIVGALVGYLHSGSISNCRVQGGSVSAMTWVGGLVGICGGTIVNCSSSASVSVSEGIAGGLIGFGEKTSTVTASFATGHVSGRAISGGLIGENNGTIDNCYSTGQVSATKSMAGGLVASVGYPDGTIRNCYSTGRVSAQSPVGGLLGVGGGASVTGSFWDRQTSGQATSAGGTGKTTTEMKRAATFAGWDFENIWTIREGVDYPKLRWAEPSGSTPPAQANIITSVVCASGESDNRAPIGQYNGNTSPLPTQAGGLKDGNLCFSDRTYHWIRTPTQLAGAEYVRTFNSDKHSTTVTYTVTISRQATVMITVDNRISNGQGAINQATARFAASGMFVNSGLSLYIHENASTDTLLSVFSAELPAGTYVFSAVPSVHTFYIIAVMD